MSLSNQQLAKHAVIQTVTASELQSICNDYESKGFNVNFPEPLNYKPEPMEVEPIKPVAHICTTCGRRIIETFCGGCGREYFEF